MKFSRLRSYLRSKVVQSVSGVDVNYLTLKILHPEVQKEYEAHVLAH